MHPPPRRLLVIHPGALGDTLASLPILAALKRQYEPATLELIGPGALVDVLPGRSVVDQMRSIDGSAVQHLFGEPAAMPPSVRTFYAGFDVVVVWMNDQGGRLQAILQGVGVREVVVASPRLHAPGALPAAARFQATLAGMGLPPDSRLGTRLVSTDADRRAGLAWLNRAGIQPAESVLLAVHPGSGSLSKCWPAKNFAQVLAQMRDEGVVPVLIEGPADAEAVRAVQRQVKGNSVATLTGVRLATVLGVLVHCRAFLGNDTGITHLAAGLGLPTVGLFGPTDPATWAPPGRQVTALRGRDGCRCPTTEEQRRCQDRPCLAIPLETVLDAIRQALRQELFAGD